MKKRSETTTRLHINAGDDMTEISIIDNQFNRLAAGLGSLSKKLAPGIYKVRWKTASASKDKLVEVTGDEDGGVLNIEAGMQAISTSAPLNNTTLGCLDKPEILKNLSENTPALSPGKASQLLVFLRDEAEIDSEFPAKSVSIHTADGTKLADFNDGFINDDKRYAGVNIGVDPGVYRLRVETGPLESYEIFVFTAENWQTRVFLTCDDFYSGSDTFRRPMLRTTSILMGRKGTRFDPNSQNDRQSEVALNALLRGYDILDSRDMRDLLHGKFDDPMLGIYGAHLLLQRKRINWELFDTVCRNLYRLVGPVPDVQALYVKSKRPMRSDDNRLAIYRGLPPMLIRSWGLLIRRSRKRYSIIPQDSLSDRIAVTVVSTEPWLMCRVEPQAEEQAQAIPNVSHAQGSRILAQMVEKISRADRKKISSYLKGRQENLNPIESAILNVVTMAHKLEDPAVRNEVAKLQVSRFDSSDPSQLIDAIGIAKQALSNLPAPSYSIARSAISLASKLKDRFDFDIS